MRQILVQALWLLLAVSMVGCGGSETSPGDTAAGLEGDAVETSSGVSSAPRVQAPPTVRIETSLGTITVVLEPEKAPLTVRNFLSYVDDGHYDGTIFHQVVDGYIVLGGGFTPEFEEKPVLEAIRNEAHNGLQNRRGTIAMARQADAIDSSTCQFFINLADNPELDHKDREAPEAYGYCVFGRVTEGLEVLDKIGKVQVQDREGFQMVPVQPVAIRSIKRWH